MSLDNLNVRKIRLQDYEYIDKWWEEHGFTHLSKSILPMNGLGGIIIEKEKPIAAAYLYLTNSKVGYIDNLITDPKYVSKDRFDVILMLIRACEQMANEVGCVEIWAMTDSEGIIERCKALGYSTSERKYSRVFSISSILAKKFESSININNDSEHTDAMQLVPSRPDIYTDYGDTRIVSKKDIVKFEKYLLDLKDKIPNIYGDGKKLVRDCPDALISHEFVDGIYIRQMDMKTGCMVISAVHKHHHCWFLLTGNITVTTEEGKQDFIAPCRVISPPGIKRVIYANEPSLFINVHKNPTNTRDIDEVENNVWAMNYEEYDKYINNKNK
jgi:N-acetylglutamate synthase-like GNAT family acetyltransferase